MVQRKRGYIERKYKQLIHWMDGLSLHNKVDDECCPDFTCCVNILPDDEDAKMVVFQFFMEEYGNEVRDFKIKNILKK